jgi:hypothetical protein
MSTRYVIPSKIRWSGDAQVSERDRIERVILSAVRQGIADGGGPSGDLVVGSAELPSHPGERFSPDRGRRGGRAYALPSYDKGGELEEVPVDAPEETPFVATSIGTSQGDTIYRSGFMELPIIRLAGNDYFYSHEGAYVETNNLGRAFQWGRHLFGGTGFIVLEPSGGRGSGGFFVIGFKDVVSLHSLGGWGGTIAKTDVDTAAEVAFTGRSGELMPLADYTIIAAITSDKVPVVSLERGAYWSPRLVELALGKAALDPEDVRIATAMLLGTSLEQGLDKAAREHLARMDRAVFAVMPWEQRARYLKLLIAGYTGEDEGNAIVEIFRATTKATELDAIFGLLRSWELDRKVFNDLSPGKAFELLQVLGELRGAGTIDTRFFFSLIEEMEGLSFSEPMRAVQGIVDWILSNAQGIYFMLSHPDDVIKAIPALFQFVDLLNRAQRLDPQAVATVAQMLAQVGKALSNAVYGAEYVEQLGRKYSEREKAGAAVGGDLIGRVRWALVLEVLSWFVGIGELKAVAAGVRSGEAAEKILAILGRLGRFVRGARALDAAAEAARLERTLVALSALAELGEEARAARLVEHLADRQLETLARIAEHANLPEGAGSEALKLALKSDRALAREADSLASALKMLDRFEQKLGGKIGPEAAAGLRHMMEHAPWSWEQGMRLAERIPAENAEEFLKALRNVDAKQFRSWELGAFEGLAQRPKAVRFLSEAGGEVYENAFNKTGQSWQNYERFIDGLQLRKAELDNPAEYQRLLDRIAANDASAFEEAFGARLRSISAKGPSAESGTLLTRAVGDSGEALASLSPEARQAAQIAADINPELTRRAVGAEYPELLDRSLAELDASLTNAGMPKQEVEKTLQGVKDLNSEQNALRHRQQTAEMMKRIQELDDPEAIAKAINERIDELTRRAAGFKDTNPDYARRLEADAERLRRLAQERGGRLTDVEAFQNEVKKSKYLMRQIQGSEEELRRLWVQYWSRRKRPKSSFAEYVEAIHSRHYVGMLGEYEVAFRRGEELILLKAPDGMVTIPGTDLVAIERATGDVLLIDNKALRSTDDVAKVDALTRNLRKNIRTDLTSFGEAAGDGRLPSQVDGAIAKLQRARDRIDAKYGKLTRDAFEDAVVQADVTAIFNEEGVRRVVTNAAGEVRGLSKELEAIGIEFMDLNL